MGSAGSEKPSRQTCRKSRERRSKLEYPGRISHRRRNGPPSELKMFAIRVFTYTVNRPGFTEDSISGCNTSTVGRLQRLRDNDCNRRISPETFFLWPSRLAIQALGPALGRVTRNQLSSLARWFPWFEGTSYPQPVLPGHCRPPF